MSSIRSSGGVQQGAALDAKRGHFLQEVRLRAGGAGHALESGLPLQPRQAGGAMDETLIIHVQIFMYVDVDIYIYCR